MAKDKTKTGVPNKHLHARISYLQQAANYLTRQGPANVDTSAYEYQKDGATVTTSGTLSDGLARQLSSHLTQTARKSQIRLHPSIKHRVCKRCTSALTDGITCYKYIENLSQGGNKPHADVLIVECNACGAKKRWPVGAKRQSKKSQRPVSGKSDGEFDGDREAHAVTTDVDATATENSVPPEASSSTADGTDAEAVKAPKLHIPEDRRPDFNQQPPEVFQYPPSAPYLARKT